MDERNHATYRFSLGRGAGSRLCARLRLRLCLRCGIRRRRIGAQRRILVILGLRYPRNEPKSTTVVGSSRRVVRWSRAVGRRCGPQRLDDACLLVIPENLGFVHVGDLEIGATFYCERRTGMRCVKTGGDAVAGGCYAERDCYPRRLVKLKWNGPGGLDLDHENWRPARAIRFDQNKSLAAVVVIQNEGSSLAIL